MKDYEQGDFLWDECQKIYEDSVAFAEALPCPKKVNVDSMALDMEKLREGVEGSVFSANLRAELARMNFTPEQAAKILFGKDGDFVNVSKIQAWLSGEIPDNKTLAQLCLKLNIHPHMLLKRYKTVAEIIWATSTFASYEDLLSEHVKLSCAHAVLIEEYKKLALDAKTLYEEAEHQKSRVDRLLDDNYGMRRALQIMRDSVDWDPALTGSRENLVHAFLRMKETVYEFTEESYA